MQKSNQHKQSSKQILTEMKKELNELNKIYNSKNKQIENIRLIIDKMHTQLYDLEENAAFQDNKVEDKKYYNYVPNNLNKDMFDLHLKKRIVIKKKNKSQSFAAWLFNNSEL